MDLIKMITRFCVTTILRMKEMRDKKMSSNVRYILNAVSLFFSATALVLCTLRFRKRAKDSIHTGLEVEELKAKCDSLQRENRILHFALLLSSQVNGNKQINL